MCVGREGRAHPGLGMLGVCGGVSAVYFGLVATLPFLASGFWLEYDCQRQTPGVNWGIFISISADI